MEIKTARRINPEATERSVFDRMKPLNSNKIICKFWLNSRCLKKPCRFAHCESEAPADHRLRKSPYYHPSNCKNTLVSNHTWRRAPRNSKNVQEKLVHKSSGNLPNKSSYLEKKLLNAPMLTEKVTDKSLDTAPENDSNLENVVDKSSQNLLGKSSDSEKKLPENGSKLAEKVADKSSDTAPENDSNLENVVDKSSENLHGKSSDSEKKLPENGSKLAEKVAEKSSDTAPKNDSNLESVVEEKSLEHVSKKTPERVCEFWVQGNCVYGDQCPYLHLWFRGDKFTMLAKLQGHKKAVNGIALPQGSNKLYSGSSDGTVRLWDCHTGQCAKVINLGGEVGSVCSEGPWVFIGIPNVVKVWNTESGGEYSLNGPVGQVNALAAVKDLLFAGIEDGVILAWKGTNETNITFQVAATLKGHTRGVTSLVVGGKRLYSGSMDHTIRVWATTEEGSLEVIYTHSEEHGVLALCGMTDPDTKPILCCSCDDNSVHLYELPSFTDRGRLFSKQEVHTLQIGPGGLFFTGDQTGLLTVWNWLAEDVPKTSQA
uniref:C3H1-type domain-containing protein n=1 Tax=Fagus sylvatica TaxID=28930 RepID=A0A2N9ID15_FAGSY